VSQIKVDEVFGFVSDEAAKVPADDAVPGGSLAVIEFFLDKLRDVLGKLVSLVMIWLSKSRQAHLLDGELLHCLLCYQGVSVSVSRIWGDGCSPTSIASFCISSLCHTWLESILHDWDISNTISADLICASCLLISDFSLAILLVWKVSRIIESI
jgi:hypothetical protein